MNRYIKVLLLNKITLILLTVSLASFWCISQMFHSYYYIIKDPMKYIISLGDLGGWGVLLFISLQLLQSIVFIIPGELLQIGAGYIYGAFWGTVISLIGISAGGGIIFFGARRFDLKWIMRLLEKKVDKSFLEKIDKINELGVKNQWAWIFLIYFIPVIPKEVVTYILGSVRINFRDYIIFSTLGRTPGILISAYLGESIVALKKYILLAVIVTVCISMIYLFKNKKSADREY